MFTLETKPDLVGKCCWHNTFRWVEYIHSNTAVGVGLESLTGKLCWNAIQSLRTMFSIGQCLALSSAIGFRWQQFRCHWFSSGEQSTCSPWRLNLIWLESVADTTLSDEWNISTPTPLLVLVWNESLTIGLHSYKKLWHEFSMILVAF